MTPLIKRVKIRPLPEEKFLKSWPCYLANIGVSISNFGKRQIDLEKYWAAEQWVIENLDPDTVYRFGVTFYFKNKHDQIEFALRFSS